MNSTNELFYSKSFHSTVIYFNISISPFLKKKLSDINFHLELLRLIQKE